MLAGSIVNSSKKIVGIGYNGFPNGCSDDELPWARKAANELDTKYPCVAPLLVCVHRRATLCDVLWVVPPVSCATPK